MNSHEELAEKLKRGDFTALARAVSIVENRKKGYKEFIKKICPVKDKALKIGITGAPGSGKSLLIDKMLDILKKRQIKIGVLAFDPSSPLSGGAILGDRLRMIKHSNSANVFIRSFASRGSLGGLSSCIFEIVELYQAAGMDIIIIETVGVGQSEIDIVNIADVVSVILTPTAGDEIQIFKAGVIEIADIFVINKADLGGADKKVYEIKSFFSTVDKIPVIVKTSALKNEGIDQFIKEIFSFKKIHQDKIKEKKEMIKKSFLLKIIQEEMRTDILNSKIFEEIIKDINKKNLFESAESFLKKFYQGV